MKPTKPILTAIIVIFNIINGQSYTEIIMMIPDHPNETDTVKIIVHRGTASHPCYLKSSNVTMVDNTIQVDAIYVNGAAATPCATLDTLTIGVFDPGNYKLIVSEYKGQYTEESLVHKDTLNFSVAPDPEKAFINLSKVWLINQHADSLHPEPYNQLYYVKIGGEAVVYGVHYRKVLQTPDTAQLNWEPFGFIRETVDRRIYFRVLSQRGWVSEERLLFDFDAEQGDTLRNLYKRYGGNFHHPAVVTNVDSVQLMNDKAKSLTLTFLEPVDANNEPYVTMEWVENIGDYKGGIIPNPLVPPGRVEYTMACFFNHGDLLFQRPVLKYGGQEDGNTLFDTVDVACRYPKFNWRDTLSVFETIWLTDTVRYTDTVTYTDTIKYTDTIRFIDTITQYDTLKVTLLDSVSLSTDNIDLAADLTANIYPVPARHGLTIELSQAVNELSYRLINSEGVVLKSGEIYNNAEKLEVDVSGLPPGTYFIQLLYDNHQKTFKVMIE